MRKVRNAFAHTVSCSFETPKVKDICSNMVFILKPSLKRDESARQQYLTTAIALLVSLWGRPLEVSKHRLKYFERK